MGSPTISVAMLLPLVLVALLPLAAQGHFFFGPPAIGFGVGLVSVHRRFPVATSIVSRRSSRQYSHNSFIRATPFGYSRQVTTSYTRNDHYYSRNHLSYYQPNVFHYQSTPWNYRWKRSTDSTARERREARLVEVGDLNTIPVNKISDVASNVSIAYKEDIWQNDMIFKDQDDCSKRLLCELNAKMAEGNTLTETEEVLANAFGKQNKLDVGSETLEFDVAAVLGRKVGKLRCELSYRRCETPVEAMVTMINVEVEGVEEIQKELEVGAIDVNDIENRLTDEDKELEELSPEDLAETTTTTTTTEKAYYPGKLPLLLG